MLLSPISIANVSESLSNATLESSESFIALVAGESLCLLTGTSLPNSSLLFNIRCHVDAHTLIDFPVLQGEDNFAYINTDVYGNFALAGSIFIDSRCDPSFADPYTLLHGHHMENSRMFGDLDLYKELDFFRQYYTGTLIIPGYQWPLRVFACMVVPSSEEKIFNPTLWKKDGIGRLLSFVKAEALHYDAETVAMLEDTIQAGETPRVIAMATCSSEYTDARTIVLAVLNDYGQENREDV